MAREHLDRKVTGLRPVDQLIAGSPRLLRNGCTTRAGTSAYYENLVASANRHDKVPDGKLLTVERGSTWNDQVIVLADKPGRTSGAVLNSGRNAALSR